MASEPLAEDRCDGRRHPGPWTCFHCEETFTDYNEAKLHFGIDELVTPACRIQGSEKSLLKALREAELEARDAHHAIQEETTSVHRYMYAQSTRHAQSLITVEETGYARGIEDCRAELRAAFGIINSTLPTITSAYFRKEAEVWLDRNRGF